MEKFKGTQGYWKESSLKVNLFIRETQNTDSDYDCNCIDLEDHEGGVVVYAGKNSQERKANAKLIASAPELLKALMEISKGEGTYTTDRLQHASNCVENMKLIAKNAIEKAL